MKSEIPGVKTNQRLGHAQIKTFMKIHPAVLGDSRKAKALCVIAIVAVLVATLWPFNAFPRNRVTWLKGTNGIKFERAGIAMSEESLALPQTTGQSAYSLEIFVRPASNKFSRTILAFLIRNREENCW